jgi:hypothetical protein
MDALFIDSSLDIFCSSFIDRRVKEFDKTFTICLCLGREWQGVALDKNKTVSTDGVTVTDNGITITASKVYCDGLSVFYLRRFTLNKADLAIFPHIMFQIQMKIVQI